jgi:hypothetical protein
MLCRDITFYLLDKESEMLRIKKNFFKREKVIWLLGQFEFKNESVVRSQRFKKVSNEKNIAKS